MPTKTVEFRGDANQLKYLEKTTTNSLLGFAPRGCLELSEHSQPLVRNKVDRIKTTVQSFESSVRNISIECDGSYCAFALGCPLFLTGIVVPATHFPGPIRTP